MTIPIVRFPDNATFVIKMSNIDELDIRPGTPVVLHMVVVDIEGLDVTMIFDPNWVEET